MVSITTLRNDVWDSVYTYLQTTNAISTNNIHSSMNSKLIKSTGYPYVILFPTEVNIMKSTANGRYMESEASILIEVYHNHSENCKTLADEVAAKLIAGRETFAGQRLMKMNIESNGSDSWQEGETRRVHRIGLTVSFRFVSDYP